MFEQATRASDQRRQNESRAAGAPLGPGVQPRGGLKSDSSAPSDTKPVATAGGLLPGRKGGDMAGKEVTSKGAQSTQSEQALASAAVVSSAAGAAWQGACSPTTSPTTWVAGGAPSKSPPRPMPAHAQARSGINATTTHRHANTHAARR